MSGPEPQNCGCCGGPIEFARDGAGYSPNAQQFAERKDGVIRLGKTLTHITCIEANPDYRPEMGEPWAPEALP